MAIRPWLTGLSVITLGVSVISLVQADETLVRRLKEDSQTFASKRDLARKAALKDFDKTSNQLRSAYGLTASAKADKLKALKAARDAFEANNTFPSDDEFAGIEFKYYQAVNKAFIPLSKRINAAIDEGIKSKNKDLEESGLKLKADLEKQLPGNKVQANSHWHGTLQRPNGSTIPYHLHIRKLSEGGLFTGHVEDNAGVAGNWGYDIEGQTSGLGVEFVLSKSTRGDFTAIKANGIVGGDRMIADVAQWIKRKPTKPVLIILNRTK